MGELKLWKLLLKIALVCCVVQCQKAGDSCSNTDTVRLEVPTEDENCGTAEGRVQFCEGNSERLWRHLCDGDFTIQDAQVICRSLGYSAIGR